MGRVEQLVQEWLDTFESQNTRKAYARGIKLLWKHAPEGFDPFAPTSGGLRAAANRWEEAQAKAARPVQPATYNGTTSAWSSFFRYLWENDLINKPPAPVRTRETHSHTTHPVPSESEVNRVWSMLLDAKPEDLQEKHPLVAKFIREDRLLFAILLNGGLRVGETVALNVEDLNFDTQYVHITGRNSKWKKRRFIQLSGGERTKRIMLDVIRGRKPEDPLFTNERGGRLSESGARTRLRHMFEEAGCHIYTPHGLRAYRATRALESGIPINIVAQQLGHSSVRTTQRYDAKVNRVVAIGDDIPEGKSDAQDSDAVAGG